MILYTKIPAHPSLPLCFFLMCSYIHVIRQEKELINRYDHL